MSIRAIKIARTVTTATLSGVAGAFAGHGHYLMAAGVLAFVVAVFSAWIVIEDRIEQRGRG